MSSSPVNVSGASRLDDKHCKPLRSTAKHLLISFVRNESANDDDDVVLQKYLTRKVIRNLNQYFDTKFNGSLTLRRKIEKKRKKLHQNTTQHNLHYN